MATNKSRPGACDTGPQGIRITIKNAHFLALQTPAPQASRNALVSALLIIWAVAAVAIIAAIVVPLVVSLLTGAVR